MIYQRDEIFEFLINEFEIKSCDDTSLFPKGNSVLHLISGFGSRRMLEHVVTPFAKIDVCSFPFELIFELSHLVLS